MRAHHEDLSKGKLIPHRAGDGSPGDSDLVVEVLSPSTRKRDQPAELDAYAASGVREYWLLDPIASAEEMPHRSWTPAKAGVKPAARRAIVTGTRSWIRQVFYTVDAVEVPYHNPLTGEDHADWIFLARD